MNLSLRSRLFLWNSVFFLGGLLLVGGIQLTLANSTAERILDESLLSRARDLSRGPLNPRRPGGPPDQGGPNGAGSFGIGAGQRNPMQGEPPNGSVRDPGIRPDGEGRNEPDPGGGMVPRGPLVNAPYYRKAAFINADGAIVMSAGEDGMWSRDLYDRSKNGSTQFGYDTIGGVKLRILSMPIRRPDQRIDVIQIVTEASIVDLAKQTQAMNLLVALPIALLASFGLSALLARLILKPVAAATAVAETLTANPNSKDRIEVQGNDEMGRLSSSFNQMTDQMQAANERIQQSLERQKQFTSDAAHELRTPITGILLAAENGLHEKADVDDMRRSLEVTKKSATSLGKLTELLLSQSRLDAGAEQLSIESFSGLEAVQAALEFAGLKSDPRILVSVQSDLELKGNLQATQQILAIFLSNAVQYISEGGKIQILSRGASLHVIDDGIGIASEHLPHLFDRFYRVDAARARQSGGYGLGLSIAKSLAIAQGAEIGVESELGKGSDFFLNFLENI